MPAAAPLLYGPNDRPIHVTKGGIGLEGTGPSLSGDATVSSVIGSGSRVPDLEVYWMLATSHPDVNACITLIADALSSDGFDVAPADAEEARPLSADDDPRIADIRTFFANASISVTDRGRRWSVAFDLKTFGFAALRKRRAAKMVAALERIDPRTLSAKTNKEGTKILNYVIRRRTASGTWDPTFVPESVPTNDIVFFSSAGGDPLGAFSSPLEALDLTLAVDFSQRRQREAFGRLGAKAGLILSSADASADTFAEARAEVRTSRSGSDNAYRTMFLPGDWKMLNKPESGKDEADFIKGTGLNKADVCEVYHVPVGMIEFAGSALGSAGKGDDRDFFEQFAVLPLEEIIYERLSMAILRDEFDIDDLALVPKRRNRIRFDRFEAAAKGVNFGVTGNEARRMVNLSAITDTRYDMDAPLFLAARSKEGIIGDEPLNPTGDTGQKQKTDDGDASGGAGAASNEVAKKASARFHKRGERARKGYT